MAPPAAPRLNEPLAFAHYQREASVREKGMGERHARPNRPHKQQVCIHTLQLFNVRANHIRRYADSVDLRLISAVGENIPAAVRGETTILEHMLNDNMLDDLYKKGIGFARYNTYLAEMVGQIAHRYPHMKILEIGRHGTA